MPGLGRAALGKKAFKAAFGAAVVVGVLSAGQAQALIVVVNNQLWNVTTYTRTRAQIFGDGAPFCSVFPGCSPDFQFSRLPWYNNQTLATQFSNAVLSALGTSFNTTTNGTDEQNVASYPGGPWFLWFRRGTGDGYNSWSSPTFCYWNGSSTTCPSQRFVTDGDSGISLTGSNVFARNGNTSLPFAFTFAQADLVPPVPGPLPALGAAAAFGFSRKLRQRIKVSKAVGASFTAA
jgi:hypothetical protein